MVRLALEGSADILAKRGVKLVARKTIVGSSFFSHLTQVITAKVSPEPSAVSEADLAELRGFVAGPHNRILMTSEDMFKRLPLKDFYDNIGLGLTLIQQLLPEHRVHVVLYTRTQPAYVESCYTQLIQMGRSLTFQKFIGKNLPSHLKWKSVCDRITAALGPDRLIVKPFEIIRKLGGTGFFHDFAESVGIPDPQSLPIDEAVQKGRSANRSYSGIAMQMAILAAPVITEPDAKRLRRFLQEFFSNDKYPRPELFTQQQTERMKSLYAEDNAALFAQYMPQYDGAALGYL